MNQAALAKLEISHDLTFLCEAELQALKIVINKMVTKSPIKPCTSSLQGIWKGKGFERLNNLENVLKQVRTEMHAAILEKII